MKVGLFYIFYDYKRENENDMEHNVNSSRKKKNLGPVIAILIIVVILILFIILGNVFFGSHKNETDGRIHHEGKYVAEINIEGVIEPEKEDSLLGVMQSYKHNFVMELIDRLEEDEENEGIMLIIDSPGGNIYETDEVYEKLMEYKKETNRPVYAYFKSVAASGGYYIACAADVIYANRNTITGSIGVTMGEIYDITEFMSKYGIKSHAVVSGRNKAMGSPTQPFTNEQAQIYQSLIDESYSRFVDVVSKGRGIAKDKVKIIADGRVYSAKQALANKLIDGIEAYEDAKWRMLEDIDDNMDIEFELFEPERKKNVLSEILKGVSEIPKGDAAVLLEMIDKKQMPISYTNEFLLNHYFK